MLHAKDEGFAHALRICLGVMATAATLALWNCDGSATQTTNTISMQGTLVDVNGNAVAGAQVSVWRTNLGLPGVAAAVAETDGNGHYQLKDLAFGEYNVFGEANQGDNAVFIPKIFFSSQEMELGVDTLMPTGAIAGSVLIDGKPTANVMCYLPGTSRAVSTDSNGMFLLEKLAPGIYDLHYALLGFSTVADIGVSVASGYTTKLRPKILSYDLSLPPSPPQGLTARFDSVTGQVKLNWNRVNEPTVMGYTLVRFVTSRLNYPYVDTVASLITDTSVVDARAILDFENDMRQPDADSNWSTYEIFAVNRLGIPSREYENQTSVQLKRLRRQIHNFKLFEGEGEGDAPRCVDTLTLTASFENPSYKLGWFDFEALAWYANGEGPKAAYTDAKQVRNGATTELKWYPGMKRYSPSDSSKVIFQADTAKPDFMVFQVTLLYNLSAPIQLRKYLEIVKDENGCYRISKSRWPTWDEVNGQNSYPFASNSPQIMP